MSLPVPTAVATNPAYRGLLHLLEGRYTTADVLARRWCWSEQNLANLRRAGQGPAYVKLGRSVRYELSEVLAWELKGQSSQVTRDRLLLAVSALKGFDDAQRAEIARQLETLLFGKR